jgi:hypothetical protein
MEYTGMGSSGYMCPVCSKWVDREYPRPESPREKSIRETEEFDR